MILLVFIGLFCALLLLYTSVNAKKSRAQNEQMKKSKIGAAPNKQNALYTLLSRKVIADLKSNIVCDRVCASIDKDTVSRRSL